MSFCETIANLGQNVQIIGILPNLPPPLVLGFDKSFEFMQKPNMGQKYDNSPIRLGAHLQKMAHILAFIPPMPQRFWFAFSIMMTMKLPA